MPADIFFLKILGQYCAANEISKAGDENNKLKAIFAYLAFHFRNLCIYLHGLLLLLSFILSLSNLIIIS